MLSVTFNQPIVISAENLPSLLALANAPAVVVPYADAAPVATPAKRTRAAKAAPTGDKPKRTRATKAEMEARRLAAAGKPAAPVPEAPKEEAKAPEAPAKVEAEAPAKPKRDRRSAAKKAADAAKEAAPTTPAKGGKVSAGKAAGNGAGVDAEEYGKKLVDRFAVLIDKDFDKASNLLSEFGAKRFGEVKPENYAAFDGKLKEAGV